MVAGAPPVRLLRVPYDSGVYNARMGAGPLALAGLGPWLRSRGHPVEEMLLEPESSWRAELRAAFELHCVIASAVTAARSRGQVPLLLSGNCNATVGVLAGLARPGLRLGLVWLDAHADFNTPDLDASGFLDGQGLAMAAGRCWQAATSAAGFRPLGERQILLIGARSLDPAEQAALRRSQVTWLMPAHARRPGAVAAALAALARQADAVHFHVDLDVYDPSIAPSTCTSGGTSPAAKQPSTARSPRPPCEPCPASSARTRTATTTLPTSPRTRRPTWRICSSPRSGTRSTTQPGQPRYPVTGEPRRDE